MDPRVLSGRGWPLQRSVLVMSRRPSGCDLPVRAPDGGADGAKEYSNVRCPHSPFRDLARRLRHRRRSGTRGAVRACRRTAARVVRQHPVLPRTGRLARGSIGADNAFAERHEPGIGAEIMGAGKSARPARRTIRTGRAGAGRTRRSIRRCSCSPTEPGPRPRWKAEPRTTSSTPRRARRSSRPVRRPTVPTCRSAAGPPSARLPCRRARSTTCMSHRCRIVLGRGVRLWDALESLEKTYDIEVVATPAASPISPSRPRAGEREGSEDRR